MPFYTYRCQECGTTVDKLYKIDQKPESITEYCQYCQEEHQHQWTPSAASINYMGINNAAKVSGDLKNRLDQIKKHYPAMRSSV